MPLLATSLLLLVSVAVGLVAGGGDLRDPQLGRVFLDLRAVRIANAGLAGAALAVAGVMMQGLFRNPLASPSVLGTASGAALGGQIALLAHGALLAVLPAWLAPELLLPLGCLAGAGLTLILLLAVARRVLAHGGDAMVALLLTGFLLSSALAAMASLLTWWAQGWWEIGRALVAFSLGGVDGKSLRHALLALPLVTAGIAAAWAWGPTLDLLLSGEDEAASLGVDVPASRGWLLTWTAVLTAAAVAVGGGVPFVGLVIPHALRPFTGDGHRRLIPAAALAGAAFLIACDAICRLAGELPLGVVTGLIGAPVFLALVLRWRSA